MQVQACLKHRYASKTIRLSSVLQYITICDFKKAWMNKDRG